MKMFRHPRISSLLSALFFFSLLTSVQAASDSLGTFTAKNPGLSTTEIYDIYGMAYGNNTYVIVGQNYITGKAFTANSTDGKTWTIRSSGSTSALFHSVIFSNGRFIAVCKQPDSGNARIWTSDTNGNSWVTRNTDNAGLIVPGGLHGVASNGNGKLVAVGGTPYLSGWMTVSNDNGTTWRVVRNGAGTDYESFLNKLYAVGYALGNWYAFSTSGTYRSDDPATASSWISGGPAVDNIQMLGYKVASNQSTIVVASSTGPKWTIDNGLTWHTGTQAKGYESVSSLTDAASSVVYADGYFVLATREPYYNGDDFKYYADIWISETGRQWKRWRTAQLMHDADYTFSLCYAKRAFWCGALRERLSKSPSWFKARNGCSSDYPYTVFDTEDGPPNRIGLPQYRVNTASLNLVLEATLFYAKTPAAPLNFKLVYNSKPCANGDTSIGPFGKNWRFRYESAVGRFGQEAQVIAGGGRSHTFATPNGEDLETVTTDVTLKAPDGIFDELKYYYNGGVSRFELSLKSSHLTYIYGTAGTGPDNTGLFYLTGITDQFGKTTTLNVSAATGLINWIDDPSTPARSFTFAYNGENLCTGISISGGRSVGFSYDADKNLIGIDDMMDYHGSYAYDEYGFMTSMTTAGKTNTFTYVDRPGYETDPIETRDKYLSSITRPGGKKIKYELQDEGETVKRTDAAGEITLFSNKDGQTTKITDPLGNIRTIEYNGAKLPETVTDEKGGVFTYKYDEKGNMTEKKDAMDNVTACEYDSDSNVTKVTNALGKFWDYTYNTKYQPLTITTPLGNDTTFTYVGKNLTNINDSRGNDTSFGYDTYGNLISISPSTSFTYTDKFHCDFITDANGKIKAIAWDNNDRITTVTYTSAGGASYTNTYNAFGQINFTDELGQETAIVRDELGYITSITDPLGNISQTEYDAESRPIKKTDPLGRITSTTYDKDGRPIVFTDSKGYTITRSYDGGGNLISFKDKNSSETTFSYDANNRLVGTTDPLKKISSITRDAIGREATITNARGQTVTCSYDDDGRLSGKTSSVAGSTPIAYTRDGNGNILTQTDAWGTTTYTYDDYNRILSITYPDTTAVALTWKAGGQIDTITYPGITALAVSYTYDNFNRYPVPSILKNNPGTELFGESRTTNAVTGIAVTLGGAPHGNYAMTYNSRGQITQMTRPNATQSDYAYDSCGRVTQIKHSGGNNVDFTADYAFNAVSNVTSETFSGDSYYQDTELPLKMALTYNIAGQLTKKGAQSCISDADGNITDIGAGTIKNTYDAENRLIQTVRKIDATTTETINNTYNAAGLRVKKEIVGGDTIVYHYLPSGILLYTTNGLGTLIDQHVYAGNALVATYDPPNNKAIQYYADRQAHVRLIADVNGEVLVKYDYLPYGQVATYKLGVKDEEIDKNPFTFNGVLGVQDEGNGGFYMQQRFYDSLSARFLSRDPLGLNAGNNLYAFGGNNPMSNADPTGKFIDPLSLVVYGLAITAVVGATSYAVDAVKSSMADVKKASDARGDMIESFKKNGDTAESWQKHDKSVDLTLDANENTMRRTGQVIVNTGIEVGKALIPGANTPAGKIVQDIVTDQIVDNAIKEPLLDSMEAPQPQQTEGGE